MVDTGRNVTAGVGSQGGPAESDIASGRAYSVIFRPAEHRTSSRDRAGLLAIPRLRRVASLTAIMLLSVGLWATIWAIVSSVAAVWPIN